MSSYPPHQVVGLPSLSPTMATGTIGKWTCKVGDKISPGDQLAEVETDKAHVPFESQDDYYIAKFLVAEGTEVKVGDPILVTVEDESSISAFADFKVSASPAAEESKPKEAPAAEPVKEQPKVEATPQPEAKKESAPEPQKQKPATPAASSAPSSSPSKAKAPVDSKATVAIHWGMGVVNSPLTRKIGLDQQRYIEKYGHCGHNPIAVGSTKEK